MSEKFYLTLDIDDSIEDTESLRKEISELPEIDEISEGSSSLGLVEAFIISLAAKMLIEILKKTPKAIKRLKELIKKLLSKRNNYSSEPNKLKVKIHYEIQTVEFILGTDEEIDEQIQDLIDYIKS